MARTYTTPTDTSKPRAQRGNDAGLGLGRSQKAKKLQIRKNAPKTAMLFLSQLSASGATLMADKQKIAIKLINALVRDVINADFIGLRLRLRQRSPRRRLQHLAGPSNASLLRCWGLGHVPARTGSPNQSRSLAVHLSRAIVPWKVRDNEDGRRNTQKHANHQRPM